MSYSQNLTIGKSVNNCFKIESYKNKVLSKTGSGFILFKNGSDFQSSNNKLISYTCLTNEHVLENVDSAVLVFSDQTRITIKGFITSNHQLDACLFIFETSLQFTGLISNYKLIETPSYEVGDKIYTISSPKGLLNTYSEGVISAKRKSETKELIQLTAPISPGSSGGLLSNINGFPIGLLVSQYSEGQNLNFAIPISLIFTSLLSKGIVNSSLRFSDPNKIYELKNLGDYLKENDPILADIQKTIKNDDLTFDKLNKTDNEYLPESFVFLKYNSYVDKNLWKDAFNVLVFFTSKYDDPLTDLTISGFLLNFAQKKISIRDLGKEDLTKMSESDNIHFRNNYNFLKGLSYYNDNQLNEAKYYFNLFEEYLKPIVEKISDERNDKKATISLISCYAKTYSTLSYLYLKEDVARSLKYLQTGLKISETFTSTESNVPFFARKIIQILLIENQFKEACKIYKEYDPKLDAEELNLIRRKCN